MIRTIDIEVNAANPQMPLTPFYAYVNSPSAVRVRNVPRKIGAWELTKVFVTVNYPNNQSVSSECKLVGGVWCGTLSASTVAGSSVNGYTISANGTDENGNAVNGYILGKGDAIILNADGSITLGETTYYIHLLDSQPSTPHKGDLCKIANVWKLYNGTEWEIFGGGGGSASEIAENNYKVKANADIYRPQMSGWTCVPAQSTAGNAYSVAWYNEGGFTGWVLNEATQGIVSSIVSGSPDDTTVTFGDPAVTATRGMVATKVGSAAVLPTSGVSSGALLKSGSDGVLAAAIPGTDYINAHQDISGKRDKSDLTIYSAAAGATPWYCNAIVTDMYVAKHVDNKWYWQSSPDWDGSDMPVGIWYCSNDYATRDAALAVPGPLTFSSPYESDRVYSRQKIATESKVDGSVSTAMSAHNSSANAHPGTFAAASHTHIASQVTDLDETISAAVIAKRDRTDLFEAKAFENTTGRVLDRAEWTGGNTHRKLDLYLCRTLYGSSYYWQDEPAWDGASMPFEGMVYSEVFNSEAEARAATGAAMNLVGAGYPPPIEAIGVFTRDVLATNQHLVDQFAVAYSATTAYQPGAMVHYCGRLYCCKLATTAGTLPTVTTNWNDVTNVSSLFTSVDTSTDPTASGLLNNSTLDKGIVKVSNALIADACPYGVNVLSAQDLQLVDGCVNTINLNAADVHLVLPTMPIGKQADLLIEITVAAGATVSGFSIVAPTGATMERIRMTDDVTLEAPTSGTTIYQFMYTSRRTDDGTGTPAYRVYSAQKKGEVVA